MKVFLQLLGAVNFSHPYGFSIIHVLNHFVLKNISQIYHLGIIIF